MMLLASRSSVVVVSVILFLLSFSPTTVSGQQQGTLLAVLGGSNTQAGMAIALMDPNTGQLGKYLWTSNTYGVSLPAMQPMWDAGNRILYVAVSFPQQGVVGLNVKEDLSNLTVASFTPVEKGGRVANLIMSAEEGNTMYAMMLNKYNLVNLITIDPSSQSYSNITTLVPPFDVFQPPFNYFYGGTSLAIDPVNKIVVTPTYTVQEVNIFLTTVSLNDPTNQQNYNWTNYPLFGVHWNSQLKKLYGIVAEPESGNKANYYWSYVDAASGTYSKISQWQDVPSPGTCGPIGTLALNPYTNTLYAMWGMGWNCGGSLSLLVVDVATGAITGQVGPLAPPVLEVVWV